MRSCASRPRVLERTLVQTVRVAQGVIVRIVHAVDYDRIILKQLAGICDVLLGKVERRVVQVGQIVLNLLVV